VSVCECVHLSVQTQNNKKYLFLFGFQNMGGVSVIQRTEVIPYAVIESGYRRSE